MTTFMTRKAAEFWWKQKLPPNVAYLTRTVSNEPWEPATWDQIIEKRRIRQASRLRRIREAPVLRAVRVSVRYFNIQFYGGWHTYVDGVGFSHWLRGGDDRLMELFPMPQPGLFDGERNFKRRWTEWMEWFASAHRRGTFHKRPRGVAYCWALCEGSGHFINIVEFTEVVSEKCEMRQPTTNASTASA